MLERLGQWVRRVPSVGRYHGRFSVIPANPILPSAFARVRNRVQKPHKPGLALFLFGAALCAGCQMTPDPVPYAQRFGVNMHPLQSTYAPDQISQQIALAHDVGASIIRIDIAWALMEPTAPGPQYWSEALTGRLNTFLDNLAGTSTEVLATVVMTPCWASADPQKDCTRGSYNPLYPPANPQDYASFMGQLVKVYKDRIKYWEIWNEPNFIGAWAHPDPAAYAALLKASYPAIKAQDAEALVLAGALLPSDGVPNHSINALAYIAGMYRAGARGYFDKLSYHSYTDGSPPTWFDARWPMHSFWYAIPAIHQCMQSHGDTSAIWITEMGWTTVPAATCVGCWTPLLPRTEAEQADYLAQAMRIARAWDYVETLLWYELVDTIRPADRSVTRFDYYLGLFRKDYSRKPAAERFSFAILPTRVRLPLLMERTVGENGFWGEARPGRGHRLGRN